MKATAYLFILYVIAIAVVYADLFIWRV